MMVTIALNQDYHVNQAGGSWERSWWVFDSQYNENFNFCFRSPVFGTGLVGVTPDNPGYPQSFGPFTSHGIGGCKYTGGPASVGFLSCPGSGINCIRHPNYGQFNDCGDGISLTPVVECYW